MKTEELNRLMETYKNYEVFEYVWNSSVYDEDDNVIGTQEKTALVVYEVEHYTDDYGNKRTGASIVAYEGDELDDDADFNEDKFLESMEEWEEGYAEVAPYIFEHYI